MGGFGSWARGYALIFLDYSAVFAESYFVAKRHTIGYFNPMSFHWKPEKNEWLIENRGICFEEIEEAIRDGGFRGIEAYVGTKRIHRDQVIIILEIDGEMWRVPA
jgi:hypothetical protein